MSRCSFLRAGQLPEVRLAGPGEPHAAVLHTDVGAGGRGHVEKVRFYGPETRNVMVTLRASAPGGVRIEKVRVTGQAAAAGKPWSG